MGSSSQSAAVRQRNPTTPGGGPAGGVPLPSPSAGPPNNPASIVWNKRTDSAVASDGDGGARASHFHAGRARSISYRCLVLLGGAATALVLCARGIWASGSYSTQVQPGGAWRDGHSLTSHRSPQRRERGGRKHRADGIGEEEEGKSDGGSEVAGEGKESTINDPSPGEEVREENGGAEEAAPVADRKKEKEKEKEERTRGEHRTRPKFRPKFNPAQKSNDRRGRGSEGHPRDRRRSNDNNKGEDEGGSEDEGSANGLADFERGGTKRGSRLDQNQGEWMSAAIRTPNGDVNMRKWGYPPKPRMLGCVFLPVALSAGSEKADGRSKRIRGGDERIEVKEVDNNLDDDDADNEVYYLASVTRLPVRNDSPSRKSSSRRHGRQHVTPYPDDAEYFKRHKEIEQKSKKYAKHLRKPVESNGCVAGHDWQIGANPNCNALHELELGSLVPAYGRKKRDEAADKRAARDAERWKNENDDEDEKEKGGDAAYADRMARGRKEGDGDEYIKYLAHGYYRDVWLTRTPYSEAVLKTLRYEHDFDDQNYDRHRRDALASMRLSGSPNIANIYGFCSNTALFEYGDGGDLGEMLFKLDHKTKKHVKADLTTREQLDIAYQVARSIADVHNVEADDVASIAHSDITIKQFISINGRYKLNDFNAMHFMRVHEDKKTTDGKPLPCGFFVAQNLNKKFRSPEEYAFQEENELIDVYSMGNIFYIILSGMWPFNDLEIEKAVSKVKDGYRATFPSGVLASKDPGIALLVSLTKECWEQEAKDRPSAVEVRDKLKRAMDQFKEGGRKGEKGTE